MGPIHGVLQGTRRRRHSKDRRERKPIGVPYRRNRQHQQPTNNWHTRGQSRVAVKAA